MKIYHWDDVQACQLQSLKVFQSRVECLLLLFSVYLSKEEQMEDEKIHAPKANGYATILAIGGVNPPNVVEQSTYTDYYFRITNSEHLTDLKDKFRRICDRTAIRKRHFMWDEEFIKANPALQTFNDPSLNLRQKVVMEEIPKQGMEAALRAIEQWGQPKSRITHLIFCTTSGVDLPGADMRLTKILGLNPSVYRVMLYQQGCFAGAAVIRIAKDLAESRQGARVLIVTSETTVVSIRAPSHENPDDLIIQALFGDGASALIVGADPDEQANERPIFSIISASQIVVPDTEWALWAHLGEGGILSLIHRDVPHLVSKKVPACLKEAFGPLGISDWNSIFWVVHPGGRAILDRVEEIAGLKPEKLQASRNVLAEYGNMAGVTVHFILDEMRRKSAEEGKATTGEGLKWGVLFGFGPGLTVETIVLRSAPLP